MLQSGLSFAGKGASDSAHARTDAVSVDRPKSLCSMHVPLFGHRTVVYSLWYKRQPEMGTYLLGLKAMYEGNTSNQSLLDRHMDAGGRGQRLQCTLRVGYTEYR